MGVTENREIRKLKDESRLSHVIRRQLEIERILDESTKDLIPLLSEYDNLTVERENLEKKLDESN